MANQDDQRKRLVDVMERQLAQGENTQKTLTLLLEAQLEVKHVIVSLQETIVEGAKSQKMDLESISQNTKTIKDKVYAMEHRQWYHSSEQKDSLRAMDQYSRGDNWTLSKAQVKGVQCALECGCASYGDFVVQCDKRRAEHQVVEEHYKEALPADELWQTGCIALRQLKVLEHLVQNGLPRILLDQFAPSVSVLEKIRDAPAMADTSGEAMSSAAVQEWEQKAQFNQKRGEAADGWTNSSQVSAVIQSAVAQPMDQDVEDSQVL